MVGPVQTHLQTHVRKYATGASIAAVITCGVAFTPGWEGMDRVARRDMIGTGHPVTYCYGQTDEFGVVKVGAVFTKKDCDPLLAKSLPKYLDQIGYCLTTHIPVKAMTALMDAAYNAGSRRVCHSPMVARMNAGDVRGGCEAFHGWIVTSDGKVRTGLIDRRAGEDEGDARLSEKGLCLQGLREEPEAQWFYYPDAKLDVTDAG